MMDSSLAGFSFVVIQSKDSLVIGRLGLAHFEIGIFRVVVALEIIPSGLLLSNPRRSY